MELEKIKNTNRSLEKRFNTLQAFFDSSDRSFVIDRNEIILEANKAFATKVGKPVEDCINNKVFYLIPHELTAFRKEKIDEAFRTGKSLNFVEELNDRYILSTLTPITSKNNKIIALAISARDITELKLAQKESQNQQMFSSALIDAIPGGFFMLDAAGRFVQWNTYERDVVVGKTDIEMPNTFALNCIHPYDRPEVEQKLMRILNKGTEESAEIRVLLQCGTECRWHQLSLKRLIINNEPFIIGTSIDITERKQADIDTIEKSEVFFRSLFKEHSSVQLIIDHETSIIIDANQAAADFYGWPIDVLRRMSMAEINLLPLEQAKQIIEKHNQSEKAPLSFQHRRADGSIRDVEVSRKIINIKGKNLSYSIIHDVTESKMAEMALKKMSIAVEQSPSVVVITDINGNIEYVNPMFTDLTGYTAEEAHGKNPRILQSGLMLKSLYEDLWKTILEGKIWRGELQNKKKNGELFWERAIISAIRNKEGVISNFVAVKEEITEQKKMMDALIAAKEKAEENDRLKSAFLTNISHEIRTPMNGILGFSELLKEPQLSSEEQAEYIDLMQQSSQRMLNLINDLIDISRIEAGEAMVQVSEIQVNEILRDVFSFFKPQAVSKGLQLNRKLGLSDSESKIVSDQAKIHQILINLVQNAIKFTRTGNITLGYSRNRTMLTFSVSDTGIGIPENMKKRIFDRFLQADNTLTRNHEGSGLGLSISKAYVEMLGGTIWVESEEGKGSTFFFTIPYNPLKAQAKKRSLPPAEQEPITPLSSTIILIAEDDELSSFLLQKNLKGENMSFLKARNGLDAVDMVNSNPDIELVLMDLKMPIMNGFEATRQIKKIRPGIPVIAQTAFTSNEDMVKAHDVGCDGFITKPIKKDDLLILVKKLLHR